MLARGEDVRGGGGKSGGTSTDVTTGHFSHDRSEDGKHTWQAMFTRRAANL